MKAEMERVPPRVQRKRPNTSVAGGAVRAPVQAGIDDGLRTPAPFAASVQQTQAAAFT